MSLFFDDILSDVSRVLFEKLVNTTFGANTAAGLQTVMPPSMTGIYPGAQIVAGGANPEVVTIVTVVAIPPSFTATFANAHLAADPITGATFPSGQETSAPLFTQPEMFSYLMEVQNDFLLRIRCLYRIVPQAFALAIRFYGQPPDCIRLERVALNPSPPPGGTGITMDLYETSQAALDLIDPLWYMLQNPPKQWFRDQINTGQFGLFPLPSANFNGGEIWYSYRGPTAGATPLTLLLVPDVFGHYMKYGVLARAFSKDGEYRDPQRADYCKKRYDLGVYIALKFMTGAGVNLDKGTMGEPDFSPMALPQTQGAAGA